MAVVIGGREQIHAHIRHGEIIDRHVTAFAHQQGAGGIDDGLAGELDPDPARRRVDFEKLVGIFLKPRRLLSYCSRVHGHLPG